MQSGWRAPIEPVPEEFPSDRAPNSARRGRIGVAEAVEGPEQPLDRLMVPPETEQGVADLPLEGGPFHRFQRVLERERVTLERSLVVSECLCIRGHPDSLVAGSEEEILRALPLLRLREVMGQEAVELLQAIREYRLDRQADEEVQLSPPSDGDALVDGLLHECVLEGVLVVGPAWAHGKQVEVVELLEARPDLVARTKGHGLEDTRRDDAAHHRRDPQRFLQVRTDAINTRDHHVPDRV